ncbi:MAG: FUN14 domain-containing protein [Ignavibacteriales bacterium]|nr:FUN14 domain-containing protein [Ignavibacteriales bacterium]
MEGELLFYLKTAGFGLLTGFVIGYLFKKVAKFAILVIAIILIGSQLMLFNGLFDIDWLTIETTAKDIITEQGWTFESVKQIFLSNLPFGIGAIIGFLFGLKKG